MENKCTDLVDQEQFRQKVIEGVRVGQLVRLKVGHPLVDYPGNPFGLLRAKSTVIISQDDLKKDVLLMFNSNDPQLPIIIGFVQTQPVRSVVEKDLAVLEGKKVTDILLDKKRIVFDAKKEIVLRCGKGSITLKADGKIVIKGTNLISRSSGGNKIKGSSVNIN